MTCCRFWRTTRRRCPGPAGCRAWRLQRCAAPRPRPRPTPACPARPISCSGLFRTEERGHVRILTYTPPAFAGPLQRLCRVLRADRAPARRLVRARGSNRTRRRAQHRPWGGWSPKAPRWRPAARGTAPVVPPGHPFARASSALLTLARKSMASCQADAKFISAQSLFLLPHPLLVADRLLARARLLRGAAEQSQPP